MRSIRRHLLAWILGALSLGTLVLLLVSYLVTLDEMNEVFQENLKQVALAVVSYRDATDDDALPPPPPPLPNAYERPGEDFDFVTLGWTPDGQRSFISDPSLDLPFDPTPGWKRVHIRQEDWYVYTLVQPDAVVQAAQRVESRSALAAESASKMFLPLVLLVVLTGALLVIALRRGLQPLDVAAQGVAARSAASLEPIADDDMPREIHPLVQAINGLMQRLSLAFATQRRFVADAAHELRTPVTALRLQLQLLERAPDEAARQAAMAELRAGVERSQRLIEQLLHLSRLEPDAPQGQPFEPVALGELARAVVASFSVRAEHQRIDLGADVAQDSTVPGDAHQLTILLNNLVDNALRYTPSGGVIDVWAGVLDGRPALRVSDSGPGIPDAERERVFDRFYRGESARLADRDGASGSGLGLAIVRSAAQRHGAEVTLHTPASGRGLEVRVVFQSTDFKPLPA